MEIDAALRNVSALPAIRELPRDKQEELDAARAAATSSVENIGHVVSGGKLMHSIVNDVLDLAKINEGKLAVRNANAAGVHFAAAGHGPGVQRRPALATAEHRCC
jgi:hypothetical protein